MEKLRAKTLQKKGVDPQTEHERYKLEEQLIQSHKMEAIGTLAGGIAHDFNNILSGILGYSQLAEMSIDDPQKSKEYIAKLVKGAQRASELIQQILIFSRKSEYTKKPLGVYTLLREVLKFLRSSIPSSIELKENISSKAMIMANSTQIHQVLINLCTNAYHAMGKSGGVLTVQLHDIEASEHSVFHGLHKFSGKFIKLEIIDTGPGIDEKIIGKIFDPYFTTKEIGKGTGLGLAMVDAIVKEHGGFLHLDSKVGRGSIFQIFLPIMEQNNSSNIHKKKITRLLVGNENLMIVDDETAIRDILQNILEKQGYKINTFDNGLSALQAFTKSPNKFDLIITDLTMPQMSGDKLSEEVLKIHKDFPIILCTGYNGQFSESTALDMGVSKYVQKPIMFQEMSAMVRELLDAKHKQIA